MTPLRAHPVRSRFVALALLLAPLLSWAAPVKGIDAYARGDYDKAITALSQELDNPALSDKDRARARIYLAASLYARGLKDEAREQLEELARRDPEQRVDAKRFAPDFVALAALAQETVETERLRERARQDEAEQQRLLAETQARAAEQQRLLAQQQLSSEASTAPEVARPAAPESGTAFHVRTELVGFSDVGGWIASGARAGPASLGVGVGAAVGVRGVEMGMRLLPGPTARWALSVEAGYAFGQGRLQPRVALRATGVHKVGLGGGGVVGLRFTPSRRLTLLADVGLERFRISAEENTRPFALTTSVGLGFNLF